MRRVAAQDRVAAFEAETAGYTMLDVRLGLRLLSGGTLHDVLLIGSNLTNALGRSHVSLLKALAPLPGRDLRLTYRLRF